MGRHKMPLTDAQKFIILKHAVGIIKTNCVQTESCADCLLLGKYPPHKLTSNDGKLVAKCPFEYQDMPKDWLMSSQPEEIFLDILPDDLYPKETEASATIPNEPGNYEKVGDKWIRI